MTAKPTENLKITLTQEAGAVASISLALFIRTRFSTQCFFQYPLVPSLTGQITIMYTSTVPLALVLALTCSSPSNARLQQEGALDKRVRLATSLSLEDRSDSANILKQRDDAPPSKVCPETLGAPPIFCKADICGGEDPQKKGQCAKKGCKCEYSLCRVSPVSLYC